MSAAATAGATSATAITIPAAADEPDGRLNALLAENAEFARRRVLYRSYQEEIDALSMRSPLTAKQAYGYLGLFLGILPPAAYFIRMGGYGIDPNFYNPVPFFLLFFMNAVCALVGWKMGKVLGDNIQKLERSSWSKMFGFVSLLALVWAAATGFAGGAIVFLIGGLFGAVFAAPVALAGFLMFAVVHRLMERGHLIEKANVLPMAVGISLIISAFILGLR